ncbi:MAG: ribonuclease P protein component [Candidatus Paceibacterota bacterium]|jgi:ribonuclease P protein component
MLPKKERIKREEMESILAKGALKHSRLFSVRVMKKDVLLSKYSFVVSKKVAKLAVERNLLRRRGYSIIKELQSRIVPGFNIVFFYKKGVEGASFVELKKEIENFLKINKLISL